MFWQGSILNSNYAVKLEHDEIVGVEYDPETGEEIGFFVPTNEWMREHHPEIPLKPSKEWIKAASFEL